MYNNSLLLIKNGNIKYYFIIILILLISIGFVLVTNLYCSNTCNCCKKIKRNNYNRL